LNARTHGGTDTQVIFILRPMVCIALDRQKGFHQNLKSGTAFVNLTVAYDTDWTLLNRFRTCHGVCVATLHDWGMRDNPSCACGNKQCHIMVSECPMTKFPGCLQALHSVGEGKSLYPGFASSAYAKRRGKSMRCKLTEVANFKLAGHKRIICGPR